MRRKLLAGNWKMNKLNQELSDFFSTFVSELGGPGSQTLNKVDVIFAVPYTLLDKANGLAKKYNLRIAAQNVHWEEKGAFTGEISIPMLKEMGVNCTIIGHSERRQFFGETDQSVAKRVRACLDKQITPIACIGETREEREQNKTSLVVTRQLQSILEITSKPLELIVAYEPVWAIGTGLSATSQQAEEVHRLIRGILMDKFGTETSEQMRILYGGSASPKNITELLSQPNIDGGLVGGASLVPKDFAFMVKAGA